jgi:hypothetical protein
MNGNPTPKVVAAIAESATTFGVDGTPFCVPVVRYRDHRLIAETPNGVNAEMLTAHIQKDVGNGKLPYPGLRC